MDRATATAYLTTEYTELAADLGLSGQSLTDAFNLALDMALRQLGFQEADLATADVNQSQILAYFALAGYYTLRRFARAYAPRTSISIAGSLSDARNQATQAVATLLAQLKAECAGLGYPVEGQAITAGRFTLDFLEPWQGEF